MKIEEKTTNENCIEKIQSMLDSNLQICRTRQSYHILDNLSDVSLFIFDSIKQQDFIWRETSEPILSLIKTLSEITTYVINDLSQILKEKMQEEEK